MFYRQILKRAWEITWENKILWFFGFFALALLGNNRAYNLVLNNLDMISRQDLTTFYTFRLYERALTSFDGILGFLNNLGNLIINKPLSIFLSILIFLAIGALALALVWLMINSQVCLIKGINRAKENKKIGFKDSFLGARKYFWPVLGLNALVQIVIYLLFIIFIYPAIAYSPFFSAATAILFLIFFLIFIPLSIILAFLTIYASSFIVLKNQRLLESLGSAWRLFVQNWLPSLEMGLILFLVDIAAALGFIILVILLGIPFILLSVIFYFLASQAGIIFVMVLIVICLVALVILFTAILSTFQYSAWTLLFLSLTEKKFAGKIVEIFSSLKNYIKKESGKSGVRKNL